MAKQVMGSELIAQPSFWPELEPAAPAPGLRQPKPAPEAAVPGLDLEERPQAEVPPGSLGLPSGGAAMASDPADWPPAHMAGPVPVEGEGALPCRSQDDQDNQVNQDNQDDQDNQVTPSGAVPALPPSGVSATATVPLEPARLEFVRSPAGTRTPEATRSPDGTPASDPGHLQLEGTTAGLVQLPSFRADPTGRRLPERLLILDTETTGLQSDRHQCIEIGAVLFHVAERAVLDQVSFLLPCQDNPAEPINGISAAVSRTPQPWQAGLRFFEAMLEAADLVVAHNVKFDRAWFGREPLPVIRKPWLCTMEDIRWPPSLRLKPTPSVRDLALAYAVPVWAAHRALTDCIYLAQVFERCGDLETLLLEGLEPRQLYRARLSYAERHRAREAGFRWNEPLRGAWSRRLSQREVALLPFPVEPADADSREAS